jgi:hypothetical protein
MSDDPQLRHLLNTTQILNALQQQFAHAAPSYLATACQVTGLRQGTLYIAASNGTLAAKLRQLAPDIVGKLQDKGCEVSGIRVKVQVSYAAPVTRHVPRLLSNTAQRQLHELSAGMAESPLKQVLERFSQKKD